MEQKDLFESSADRLPYVECSPKGRGGPVAAVCRKNNIKSYPTWIVDGQKYTGVLKPERLAAISGYSGTQ